MPELTFSYEPIDVAAIAKSVADGARAALDLYLQQFFIGYIRNLSHLTRLIETLATEIAALKAAQNTKEPRHE